MEKEILKLLNTNNLMYSSYDFKENYYSLSFTVFYKSELFIVEIKNICIINEDFNHHNFENQIFLSEILNRVSEGYYYCKIKKEID